MQSATKQSDKETSKKTPQLPVHYIGDGKHCNCTSNIIRISTLTATTTSQTIATTNYSKDIGIFNSHGHHEAC